MQYFPNSIFSIWDNLQINSFATQMIIIGFLWLDKIDIICRMQANFSQSFRWKLELDIMIGKVMDDKLDFTNIWKSSLYDWIVCDKNSIKYLTNGPSGKQNLLFEQLNYSEIKLIWLVSY